MPALKAGVVHEPPSAAVAPVPAHLPAPVPARPAGVAVRVKAEPARWLGLLDQHPLDPVLYEPLLPHDRPRHRPDVLAPSPSLGVVLAGALPPVLLKCHLIVHVDGRFGRDGVPHGIDFSHYAVLKDVLRPALQAGLQQIPCHASFLPLPDLLIMHYIDLSPKDPIAAGRRKIIPSQKTDAAAGNPGRSKFIVYDVNGAVRRSRARIWRRTALLSAEIDDITRFGNPKKLVSWAGMCPTLHQSGGTSYHGRMKKDSNRKVNWIMIQCAHVAAMHDDR